MLWSQCYPNNNKDRNRSNKVCTYRPISLRNINAKKEEEKLNFNKNLPNQTRQCIQYIKVLYPITKQVASEEFTTGSPKKINQCNNHIYRIKVKPTIIWTDGKKFDKVFFMIKTLKKTQLGIQGNFLTWQKNLWKTHT